MTCQGTENVVSVIGMKFPNLAYIGGGVIVAVMFLAVFIGGANAGDCPRGKSVEVNAVEAHHNSDEKSDVEA